MSFRAYRVYNTEIQSKKILSDFFQAIGMFVRSRAIHILFGITLGFATLIPNKYQIVFINWWSIYFKL